MPRMRRFSSSRTSRRAVADAILFPANRMITGIAIEHLRSALEVVAPYPAGVVPVPERVPGSSFFPGGDGVWYQKSQSESPTFPRDGIMVLGQDYYSLTGYRDVLARGKAGALHPSQAPTWSNLRKLLPQVSIAPRRCFFTNLFMGLREGENNTGEFPGTADDAFVERCLDFLVVQLEIQRPRLILALGKYVPLYLGRRAPAAHAWSRCRTIQEIDAARPVLHDVVFRGVEGHNCSIVALVHPSMRNSNVRHRRYGDLVGNEAELAMVRDAVSRSGVAAD